MTGKKINILFVLSALNNGGAEMLVIRLCKYLDKTRFNVSICSLSSQGALQDLISNYKIPLFILEKKEGRDFSIVKKLKDIIIENEIDIVHTHNQGPLIYSVLASLLGKRHKLVHTEHINMMQEYSYSRKNCYYNKFLYRFLDGFVSIANHLTECVLEQFPRLTKKTVTIRNCVDMSRFDVAASGENLREKLGLAEDSVLLGNISALRRQKDHGTMLRAMVQVARHDKTSYLVIAGDGECAGELKTQAEELGLNGRVFFLGYRADIENLLCQFSLFLLTSLYEGLPLCLLEAMAMRCPVVATDVTGTNELVRDGETGILVPAGDDKRLAEAILLLVNNPEIRGKFVSQAAAILKSDFNFTAMIRHYEDYYASMISRGK